MPTPPTEPGFVLEPFGKYVLVHKLAEGGMAEIFLAKQTGVEGFERNVVIKRMLPHISRQKRFVNMFLDEARLAARLTHANVIPLYEVGLIDESYYICMEYLPGADLGWILQRAHEGRTQLPIEVALRIIIAAARGLHHAHEFKNDDGTPVNIVHRDVSPSNLYVSYEGQVKVLDFGIAKAESRITSTRTGTIKGKTHYMAPEQSQAAPVDRRADVYSLGVTLYEALTVWPPFLRGSVRETFDAVMKNEYRPPRLRRPEIPQLVERACMKAMAFDPKDRQQSCAELADDLAGALDTPLSNDADPLIGRFLRDLSGEAEIARKTRIPNLPALEREMEARARDAEARLTMVMRIRRTHARLGPIAAALLVAIVVAGGLFIAWRAHQRAAPASGCNVVYGSSAPNAITLAASLPLSVDGVWEDGQIELVDALRLAVDEINGAGGVGGRPFGVRVCDNAGDVPRLKNQISWLIDHEHIPALFMSWSSLTMAAVNLTLPRGVVIMTADATSPELAAVPAAGEGGVRMLWRTAPSDATQAELAAQFVSHDRQFAGVKRIGILYQDDPYGQGWAGTLETQLPRLFPGVAIHAIQFPFRGDVSSAVEQLAAVKPDVTMLICFPLDAVRVLDVAARAPSLQRAHGHRWFFADSIKEPSLLRSLEHPDEIDGAYGIESADGGGEEAASFQKRFYDRFARNATEQTFASHRYDAMYLVALATAWASGSDGKGAISGARIADGLTRLSKGPRFSLGPEQFPAARAKLQAGEGIDIVGASGDLDFDAGVGEAHGAFQLWRVAGKGFVRDRRLTPIVKK